MTVMMPFENPCIETRFERPLLSASARITRQSAAVALRRWWRLNSDRERAEIGMVITRSDISDRNYEIGKSIPVNLFCSNGSDDHEIILAAFADQSAIALKARAPGTYAGPSRNEHPLDDFNVLPIVLHIASIARPKTSGFLPADGLGGITLSMRGSKTPLLALSREHSNDGWVNAEASWTVNEFGLDDVCRAELLRDLAGQTEAWTRLLKDLPPLTLPENGRPSFGPVSTERAGQTGLSPETLASAPAFLEWAAFTDAERRGMSDFIFDAACWLQLRTNRRWQRIEIDIHSAQPTQIPLPAKPQIKINLAGGPAGPERTAEVKRLTGCLERILKSELSPVPYSQLVGQVECDYRNRRTWMAPVLMASRFSSCDFMASNHQALHLEARFAPFWT